MGEGFKRFKRLYTIDAIARALLMFLGASLLIVATFLIVIDKGVIDFQIIYALLIGVGSGLLLGLVTFLLSYKGDKRLAKALDERLGLKEKVQTMYAFRGKDGLMTEIQRAETKAILDNTPTSPSFFFKVWAVFATVFVLALAYFITALAMYLQVDAPPLDDTSQSGTEKPGDEKPGDKPSEEEIFEATDHHKRELEQLIKYVNDSYLNENAKVEIVLELTVLLGKLDTFGTEEVVKEYVIGVIERVCASVNAVNSTYAFYHSSKELGNKTLDKISRALYLKDLETAEREINSFYKSLLFVTDGETESLRPKDDLEDIKDEIDALKNALTSVLENSGMKQEDKLYVLTSELVAVFNTVIEKSASTTNVRNRLAPVLTEAFVEGLRQLVPQEKINEEVKEYTVEELARIFGIDLSEIGSEGDAGNGEYVEPDTNPSESENGGSYGDGGNNFPSDDKVIDPESGEIDIDKIQVEYGDIIARYITEIKNKIEKGEYSEELAAILNEYFKILTTPKQ